MKKTFLVMIAIFSVMNTGSFLAFGEGLQDICQSGINSRLDLKALQSKVRQSEFELSVIEHKAWPTVDLLLNETFQDNSAQGSGASSVLTNPQRSDYKIAVKQTVFTGFRNDDAMWAARESVIRQRAVLDVEVLKAKRQIARDFFEMRKARVQRITIMVSLDLVNQRYKETLRRVNLGKSRSGDLALIESEKLSLDYRRQQTLASETMAVMALRQSLGLAFDEPMTLSGMTFSDVPTENLDYSFDEIVKNWPEIKQVEADLNVQKALITAGQRGVLPTVAVGGNYYLKRADYLNDIRWDVNIGVGFPLFQGGVDSAQIQVDESKSAALRLNLESIRRQLSNDLQRDIAVAKVSYDAYIAAKKAFEMTRKAYDAYMQDYKNGLSDLLPVIQMAHSLSAANDTLALAENEVRYRRALLHLYKKDS